jgi:hypothetical protein
MQAEQQQQQQQQQQEQPSMNAAQRFGALLNRPAVELLQTAVQRRLNSYAAPLEEDMRQLARLEAQQAQQAQQQAQQQPSPSGGSRKRRRSQPQAVASKPTAAAGTCEVGEQAVAERAALVLRITEKEVLRDLITATQRRLAASPAQPLPGRRREMETSLKTSSPAGRAAKRGSGGSKQKRQRQVL